MEEEYKIIREKNEFAKIYVKEVETVRGEEISLKYKKPMYKIYSDLELKPFISTHFVGHQKNIGSAPFHIDWKQMEGKSVKIKFGEHKEYKNSNGETKSWQWIQFEETI